MGTRMVWVCPSCRVYCREGRSDGWNVYTVCSYCGRPELVLEVDKGRRPAGTKTLPATRSERHIRSLPMQGKEQE